MRKLRGYFATLVILLVMLVLGACQSVAFTTSEPSPVEVVEALEEAFNAQDIDAIMALYAEDAVWINSGGAWKGAHKIRLAYGLDLSEEGTIDNTNIRMEGDTVLYDCQLIDKSGETYKMEKYEAVVENGKIKTNFLEKNLD